MNLIGSHYTILSIVYYKAQGRGWIFIAMKIRETEMKGHKTREFHSILLCCINQLLTWHMSFKCPYILFCVRGSLRFYRVFQAII